MCIEFLTDDIETETMKMTKSIKISDNSHKALEFAKVLNGIEMGKYVSVAIMEAIQKDYPEAYEMVKKHLTTEEKEKVKN